MVEDHHQPPILREHAVLLAEWFARGFAPCRGCEHALAIVGWSRSIERRCVPFLGRIPKELFDTRARVDAGGARGAGMPQVDDGGEILTSRRYRSRVSRSSVSMRFRSPISSAIISFASSSSAVRSSTRNSRSSFDCRIRSSKFSAP